MKILSRRLIPIVGSVSLLTAGAATAQEFFRDFGSSRSSAGFGRIGPGPEIFIGNNPNGIEPLSDAGLAQDEKNYNIRIGAFDLTVAAGAGIEFNDNIALSEFDRESDFILRPALDIEGAIRFSERSRLRLGVGLSYAKYFNNSEFDSNSILISPTSAIAWTAEIGAFTVTVRERLSYQEDPFSQPTLNNVVTYQRWENQAGIQVDWDANQYTKISVGYDRYDLWTPEQQYLDQEKGINTVFLRPSYQFSPRFTAGLSGSLSMFDYTASNRSNGYSWLLGPFVRWQVNDFTDVYAEVGYQAAITDGPSIYRTVNPATGLETGRTVDNSNGNSWYAKVEIVNRPTEFLRQKLSFSKTTELGFQSNFYDLYHVEYTLDWAFRENTTIRPILFYEYYETSGNASEEANRLGAALGIYHIFSDNFTAGIDYRFLTQDSNLNGADYYQNLVLLSVYYKF